MKRLVLSACVSALLMGPLGGTVAANPTGAAAGNAEPHGVMCSLSGKATFSEGLTGEVQKVSYKFTGTLDDCESSDESLESGHVVANGSGELSCEYGTSEGTANVHWDNGESSVIDFTTREAGAYVDVQTTAAKSDEPAVAKGDNGHGSLVFQANPEDCSKKDGVKTATFDGTIGSSGS